jgi:hypothetical protein
MFELTVHAREDSTLLVLRAFKRGRVGYSPMRRDLLPRPYRALLGSGLAAHGENKIETWCFRPGELIPTLGTQVPGFVFSCFSNSSA